MSEFFQAIVQQFQFESAKDFFLMGKHTLYVWLCYGAVFILWGYLAIAPSLQNKSFFKQEFQRLQRKQALEKEG